MSAPRFYVDRTAMAVRQIHTGGQAHGLTFETEAAAHSALLGWLDSECHAWREIETQHTDRARSLRLAAEGALKAAAGAAEVLDRFQAARCQALAGAAEVLDRFQAALCKAMDAKKAGAPCQL